MYCATDLSAPKEDLVRIIACVSDIMIWVAHNKLKINDEKTKFFAFTFSLHRFDTQSRIPSWSGENKTIKQLQVMFDSLKKLEDQVQSTSNSVNFQKQQVCSQLAN